MRRSISLLLTLVACGSTIQRVTIVAPDGTVRATVSVEHASDSASRARGLMGRTELPSGHGMLFTFPDARERTFWMKDTRIPLDMIFVDERGVIIHVAAEQQPCTEDPCPLTPSHGAARYVLELAGGEAATLGIVPGDTLRQ